MIRFDFACHIKHPLHHFLLLLIFPLVLVKVAYADDKDVINFIASTNYTHDNNVFRLSSNAGAFAGGERWDNILTKNVGVKVNKKYSLQGFRAEFFHVENSYQNNDILDFNANNYKVAWLWSLTPYLTGTLSADRTSNLIGFSDFRSRTQNIRTEENRVFDLDWSPHANWHFLAGLSQIESQNTQNFNQDPSSKSDIVQVGGRYVFPSTAYIELVYKDRNGNFGRRAPIAANLLDTGFEDQSEELKFFWPVSGKSRITSNFGRISRKHDNFEQRDFSGNFGGITYIWDATGQVSISTGFTRTINSFQSDTSNYVVNDSLFVTPSWQISSKLYLSGKAQVGTRMFKGDGPVSLFEREDDTRLYSLSLNWAPRTSVVFGVSLLKDQRSSNYTGFDYVSESASINAQLTF